MYQQAMPVQTVPVSAIQPDSGNMPSSISYADPAAVAAAESAKAHVQSQYAIAKRFPRSYEQSRFRIIEACKRPKFAEKAEYSKPVGGSCIKGPSIRFAELALREWGNINYVNQVIYDDEMTRRVNIHITDLETNATFSAAITINKTIERKDKRGREVISERLNANGQMVYIVKATEDEVQNKQANLVSKALRNEGLRLIPQEIIEEAMEVVHDTVKKNISTDPDAERRKLIDAFLKIGVQPKNVEEYLGHPLEMTTPAELGDLRAIFNSVKNGEAKWTDFVTSDETEREENLSKAKEKLKELTSMKKSQQKENTAVPSNEAAPVKESKRPPAQTAKPQAMTEQHRILKDNMGEFGLGLNDKEIAARIKSRFNKTLEELTPQEALILNNEIIEEMRNRG